jgi:tartrate dehydratase beta subunit/fumarate hydratase class I family protein
MIQKRGEIIQRGGKIIQKEGEIIQRRGEIIQKRGEIIQKEMEIIQKRGEIIQKRGKIYAESDLKKESKRPTTSRRPHKYSVFHSKFTLQFPSTHFWFFSILSCPHVTNSSNIQ